MFIEEVIEVIKNNIPGNNKFLITPPPRTEYCENMLYLVKDSSSAGATSKGINKIEFNKAKEDFGKHITTNLDLKCVDASNEREYTAIIRSILGNIYFRSPLEIYGRKRDLNNLEGIKVSWFMGVFKQISEIVFFYLNFINPKIKAIFRAGLQLDFDFGDLDNQGTKKFIDHFNNFLSKVRDLKETNDYDWVKITELYLNNRIIIKSEKSNITTEIDDMWV